MPWYIGWTDSFLCGNAHCLSIYIQLLCSMSVWQHRWPDTVPKPVNFLSLMYERGVIGREITWERFLESPCNLRIFLCGLPQVQSTSSTSAAPFECPQKSAGGTSCEWQHCTTSSITVSSVSNWQIHRCLFILGNRKKSEDTKLGEYRGEAAVQICVHADCALSLALCVVEHCHDARGLQATFLDVF